MNIKKVEDIVNESIHYQDHFPDLNIIINAIKDGHELNPRFVNYLVNWYIKEDDDLIKVIDLMIERNYKFDKFIIFDLAINGFFKTMKYFKKMGFDLNIKNEQNENALFYVIRNGVGKYNHIDLKWRPEDFIVETVDNCIKLGIDEKVINKKGRNLFHICALSWGLNIYFDTLHKLNLDINQIDKNGWTPLHLVCAYYDDELYKTFLKNGADKSILTKNRITDFEAMYNLETTPEICSAYDLRLHHLNSDMTEFVSGTDAYNYNVNEIEIYLKPD